MVNHSLRTPVWIRKLNSPRWRRYAAESFRSSFGVQSTFDQALEASRAQSANWAKQASRLASDTAAPAARQAFRRVIQGDPAKRARLGDIRDLTIPCQHGAMRARLYTPASAGEEPGPLTVFFHGGGFVIGNLDSHDGVCRRLAGSSRARVLSVEYRLAPKHPFPGAVDDALAAFDWAALEGADELRTAPKQLAVAGDSAGGNLAAVVAQQRRDAPHAPVCQALIYPLLQLVHPRPAQLRVIEGHKVSEYVLRAVRQAYAPDHVDVRDPLVSPLYQRELAGVCPAYIMVCAMDPLRDEGEAYARRLRAAGVPVHIERYGSMPHGFIQMENRWTTARQALEQTGRALTHAFGKVGAEG